MKNTTVAGKSISKMSLGTVQFGLHYGIANDVGKPPEEQSFEMIKAALDGGVTSIDTARAYGDSEDIIGRYFKENPENIPFISTKVPPFPEADVKLLEKHIIESVETSLECLGLKKVENIMLHNGVSLFRYGDETAKIMGSLVKRGYCDMVGASVYDAKEIDKMLTYEEYTATQVPMSIFDQRLIADGSVARLQERDYSVFVRSVFLQGLFFLDPDTVTDPILTAADFVLTGAEAYEVPKEVNRCYFFNPFSVEILHKVMARILDSWYEDPREIFLFFYYPDDAYIAYLMTVEELEFYDEIPCDDLFPGDPRERVLIFQLPDYETYEE